MWYLKVIHIAVVVTIVSVQNDQLITELCEGIFWHRRDNGGANTGFHQGWHVP